MEEILVTFQADTTNTTEMQKRKTFCDALEALIASKGYTGATVHTVDVNGLSIGPRPKRPTYHL